MFRILLWYHMCTEWGESNSNLKFLRELFTSYVHQKFKWKIMISRLGFYQKLTIN